MCILFIYNGANNVDSDYSLILVTNRDEFYERPSKQMGPWTEDSNVYGGRDLQPGSGCGTWMAINPISKKMGLLLNLPGAKKENAKSRGKIVADFVKSDYHTIVLITKSGQLDLIEISMQSPIDVDAPQWKRKEFKFDS